VTRAWLTRRPNGRYFLTRLKPITSRILGTDDDDIYLNPGEPVGIDMCPAGVHAEIGRELKLFESARVKYTLELEGD